MINFNVHTQAFAEVGSPYRHNHKFLDIHVVVSMLAAVQDVHHRNRQFVGIGAAQILVQGQAHIIGSRFGYRHGYAQNGIGA